MGLDRAVAITGHVAGRLIRKLPQPRGLDAERQGKQNAQDDAGPLGAMPLS